MSSGAEKLAAVSDVDIDTGRFKYVLIQLTCGEHSKVIVRGYQRAGFHADVYDECWERLEPLGVDTECLGGGRIIHEPENKKIKVFGYSQGFGRADHSVATDILKKKYHDYDISWSNEGY